jgi:hypothetical protein
MHLEATQPMYYVGAYWLNLMPAFVWERQVILTQLKTVIAQAFTSYPNATDSTPSRWHNVSARSVDGYWMLFPHTEPYPTNDEIITNITHDVSAFINTHVDTTLSTRAQVKTQKHVNQRRYKPQCDLSIPSGKFVCAMQTMLGRRKLLSTDAIDTSLSDEARDLWNQGPYAWPPNYQYYDGENTCAIASTMIHVVINGAKLTAKAYDVSVSNGLVVDKPFWSGVLDIIVPDFFSDFSLSDIERSFRNIAVKFASMFISPSSLERWVFHDRVWVDFLLKIIRCDFAKMQVCPDRETLIWISLKVLVVFVAASIIAKVLEIPYVDFVLCLLFIPMILTLNYQYSTTCGFMLPSCLIRDLLNVTEFFLPERFVYPPELLISPTCVNSTSCYLDCSSGYFNYDNWQDHAAWILCETSTQLCTAVADAIKPVNGTSAYLASLFEPMAQAIRSKRIYFYDTQTYRTMIHAQRICFIVTLAQSLPIFVLVTLALLVLPIVLTVLVSSIVFFIQALVGVLLFIHTNDGEMF